MKYYNKIVFIELKKYKNIMKFDFLKSEVKKVLNESIKQNSALLLSYSQ
jgi:hypothetical protein